MMRLDARQGANTCAIGGVLKESALMWAARQGYMTIIVDLLRVSKPPNLANQPKSGAAGSTSPIPLPLSSRFSLVVSCFDLEDTALATFRCCDF